MIDYGAGFRIDRLRRLWHVIAKHVAPSVKVEFFPSVGSHAETLKAAYDAPHPERFLVLTELDFLPDLDSDWTSTKRLLAGAPLVGPEYRMRSYSRALRDCTGICGGWYLALDRSRLPDDLDFGGPDPGNRLQDQVPGLELMEGEDDYPRSYGVRYSGVGTHGFFSRHLHDSPHQRVSGINLGDVQMKHDRWVDDWWFNHAHHQDIRE